MPALEYPSQLAGFTGSENFYRIGMFGKSRYTEGCKYLADHDCAWMITDMLSVLHMEPKVRAEEFVSIKFIAETPGVPPTMYYTDGNEKLLFKQEYTGGASCKFDIQFFYTDNCLMLASEY